MNVLITGACGLLGGHLAIFLARGHNVVGIDRHPWWGDKTVKVIEGDLTDTGFIKNTVARVVPEILIHCAAMVDVDACERNPSLAYACNAHLVRNLVRAAPSHCLFVYITTDSIFAGDKPFATEEELPCPRTVYARSKLHGEWDVRLATDNHLIVRTNFYGWSSGRKQSSAEWLYHALEARESITLFDDFFFTPIYVVDIATCLNLLIECGHRGTFHLCGKERVSKYEFGALMAKAAGFSIDSVRRGSIGDIPLAAPRPKDMSLDSGRFQKATGVEVPACMHGLQRFLGDRGRPLSKRFEAMWNNLSRADEVAGTPGLLK